MSAELLIRLPDYFTNLIDAMQDGFILRGIDGTIIETNAAFCRMIGYDRSEIIGRRPPHAWWSPEDRERFDAVVPKYLSGAASEDDLFYVRRNGQRFPAVVTSAPLVDSQGHIIAYIGTIKDMTERTRIEEQVSVQAALIDNMRAAVIATDPTGTITLWNNGAAEMFGWRMDEVEGRNIRDFIVIDDTIAHAGTPSEASEFAQSEGDVTGRRRDGSVLPIFLSNAAILNQQGETVGVVSVAVDVSEQQRSRQRLSAQHDITRVLVEAETEHDGIEAMMRVIGTHLDWAFGMCWLVDERGEFLRSGVSWIDPSLPQADRLRNDQTLVFRRGEGMPGRTWQRGRPVWSADVRREPGFLRHEQVTAANLTSWVGFPIIGGSKVYGVVEFFSNDMRDSEPELMAMLGAIGRQIGQFLERRRAEDALRESESRFRIMADYAPVLLWVSDAQTQSIWFNKAWREFAGRSTEETEAAGWLEGIHPDDSDRCREMYTAAMESHTPFSVEYRRQRHDGEYRWLMVNAVPRFTPGGQFAGFISSCIDITDRRRSEENQRFLSDATQVLASSLDYRATLASVADLAVTDVADWCVINIVDDDGAIDQTIVAHHDPNRAKYVEDIYSRYAPVLSADGGLGQVLRTGESILVPAMTLEQIEAIARDSTHLELIQAVGLTSIMIVPIAARGRVLGTVSLVSGERGRHYDADDLALAQHLGRRAAVAIDNARLFEEAREASRARDQFLAVAAHELRSPLTSMKGFAQLLLRRAARTPGGDEWHRGLQTIDTQVNRVANLVNRLLDVSRIQEQRLFLEVEPIDMVTLVRAAVDEAQLATEQHVIRLSLPESPVIAEVDRSRIEQVLANLLDNAVKYSPEHEDVDVTLETFDDRVRVSIRDRGPGIEEKARNRIFERYFRAASDARPTSDGLGLGLYVAHGIVEAHHGEMKVESEIGQGSTFSFVIPRQQPSHSEREKDRTDR